MLCILILSDTAQFNLGTKGRGDSDKMMSQGWGLKTAFFFIKENPQTFKFFAPASWLLLLLHTLITCSKKNSVDTGFIEMINVL